MAGALQSEHLAAILDFGVADDGTPYIVMEYLVGESLAALLSRVGRLPLGARPTLASRYAAASRSPTPRASFTAISSRRICSSAGATTAPIWSKSSISASPS